MKDLEMKTSVSVGHSLLKNTKAALKEAISMASGQSSERPSFALIFSTAGHDQQILMNTYKEILPDIKMSGCSGEGIIFKGGSTESAFGMSCMLFFSKKMSFYPFSIKNLAGRPEEAGKELANIINAHEEKKKKLVFLFPDALTVNTTRFFSALDSHLHTSLPIIGGSSGDQMQLVQTFQYFNGEVSSDSCSGVLMGGDFSFDFVVNHGCTPLGEEKTVTKVRDNFLVEIEGQPAWSVLRTYLADPPEKLGGAEATYICVGEKIDTTSHHEEEFKIHAPMALTPQGEVMFASELNLGSKVVMTRRDPKRIIELSLKAAKDLRERKTAPMAVFQFDCAGRGRMLFGEDIDEVMTVPLQENFSKDVPWIGFHTYGEITSLKNKTQYNNYTLSLCTLYDE